ncbi:MAG: hypothetical protein AB1746_16430, partial [Candidatus Zixiibacteriota bacterium]
MKSKMFLMNLIVVCILCMFSATAFGEECGSIATSAGPSILDKDLDDLLDQYIPESSAQSRLLIFTECYAGDKLDDFADNPKTTVISATVAGQTAQYGGYHDDAADSLYAGPGRTADDVHAAGIAGKGPGETPPPRQGPNASLEPTDPAGTIKSRHVLVFNGMPNAQDNADRDAIENNFAGDPNTTVTTCGGNGTGYDYPGTRAGLEAALNDISANMSPDEQFILFVGDHGNLEDYYDLSSILGPIYPGIGPFALHDTAL